MLDFLADSPVPASAAFRALAPFVPSRLPLPGAALHRAGLHALSRGDASEALRLFHRAGLRYRRETAVEPLARLRVHELMARAAGCADGGTAELQVEVARRLSRLAEIEDIVAPFTPVDAGVLLARWLEGSPAGASERAAS